jgi:RNA polymerase sigma factor (sigma-70 family)
MRTEADAEFEAVFDDLRMLAYRAAYRLLGQRSDAEDIAAETMVRVYARWPKVAGHARPWAVTVAANLALDRGRRARTAEVHRESLISPDAPLDPHLEQRLDLQAALRALPKRQREVIALRFLADWSTAETSAALGLDVGTVKSHTSRGLARLRTILVSEDLI